MTPLKITATINGWMAEPEYPLYLDSLVSSQVVSRAKQGAVGEILESLPFEEESRPEGSVWKASAFVFKALDRSNNFSTRVTDKNAIFEDTGGLINSRAKKVVTSSGPFKNYARYTGEIWVTTATAYCIGDQKEIERLLSGVENLGKLGKHNLGKISSLTVEVVDIDDCEWERRATPWENRKFPTYKGVSQIKPPYFKKPGRAVCYIPKNLVIGDR